MNDERPCKNCKQLKSAHDTGKQMEYVCVLERLPVQLQELYYVTSGRNDTLWRYVVYQPMDNLEYLEHEYYKELNDAPTRRNLS